MRELLREGQKRMRLICPNCDAEYQVDDAAIPEGGRDVQCSNCGHAWFQLPADVESAREAEDDLFGEDAAIVETASIAATSIPEPEIAISVSDVGENVVADQTPAQPIIEGETVNAAAPARQTLAESVLSVLREEAERETAVRRVEAPLANENRGAIETQTEFGLDDPLNAAGSTAAARHIARLKGTEPEAPLLSETRAAARRDLLPDIEEINSTLRANSDRAQEADAAVEALPDIKQRRRGFRSGFVLMMIIAVAMAMTYVMAPRIVAQIPGSAPAMKAYISSVDAGRLWLDGVMKSASGSLRNFSGDGN